jgi:hypothetical protein
MSSPYKEDKNNETNKEKENNDEGHNNGDDEFKKKIHILSIREILINIIKMMNQIMKKKITIIRM